MKKIICAVLAVIMACTLLVACKKNEVEEQTINVKLTIKNGTEKMYGPASIATKTVDGKAPTVLDVILNYLDENEITYEKSTLASYEIITSIDGVKETKDSFWQVLVDGKEPKARYAALLVEEGNNIEFFIGKNLDGTGDTTEAQTETRPVQTANDDYNG